MSLSILIDMNLPPVWVTLFQNEGIEAVHWSEIGDGGAPDTELMQYARTQELVLLTYDLDFGTLLALTHESGPSVVQVRGQSTITADLLSRVASEIKQYEAELKSGALLVVDNDRSRVRILPI